MLSVWLLVRAKNLKEEMSGLILVNEQMPHEDEGCCDTLLKARRLLIHPSAVKVVCGICNAECLREKELCILCLKSLFM